MVIGKINLRFVVLIFLMILVAAMHISNAASLTPLSNFTPIGAMGLSGGAYFTKQWEAILFSFLTLFASDMIIQVIVLNGKYGLMYSGWYWIYGIFISITFYWKMAFKKSISKECYRCSGSSVTYTLVFC